MRKNLLIGLVMAGLLALSIPALAGDYVTGSSGEWYIGVSEPESSGPGVCSDEFSWAPPVDYTVGEADINFLKNSRTPNPYQNIHFELTAGEVADNNYELYVRSGYLQQTYVGDVEVNGMEVGGFAHSVGYGVAIPPVVLTNLVAGTNVLTVRHVMGSFYFDYLEMSETDEEWEPSSEVPLWEIGIEEGVTFTAGIAHAAEFGWNRGKRYFYAGEADYGFPKSCSPGVDIYFKLTAAETAKDYVLYVQSAYGYSTLNGSFDVLVNSNWVGYFDVLRVNKPYTVDIPAADLTEGENIITIEPYYGDMYFDYVALRDMEYQTGDFGIGIEQGTLTNITTANEFWWNNGFALDAYAAPTMLFGYFTKCLRNASYNRYQNIYFLCNAAAAGETHYLYVRSAYLYSNGTFDVEMNGTKVGSFSRTSGALAPHAVPISSNIVEGLNCLTIRWVTGYLYVDYAALIRPTGEWEIGTYEGSTWVFNETSSEFGWNNDLLLRNFHVTQEAGYFGKVLRSTQPFQNIYFLMTAAQAAESHRLLVSSAYLPASGTFDVEMNGTKVGTLTLAYGTDTWYHPLTLDINTNMVAGLNTLTIRLVDGYMYLDYLEFSEYALPTNAPPAADAGDDQTVEQAYYQGADVTLDGSGSSDPDGDPLTFSWTWAGGSDSSVDPTVSLPLGTTTVTLVVNDGTVDSASDTVDITVEDTTAPGLVLPADVTVEQETKEGTVVDLVVSATDLCDADVTIDSDELIIYALGTTTVTFTATDASSNSTSGTVMVTVEDTIPPDLTCSLDTEDSGFDPVSGELFPPNHRMVDFLLDVAVTDICDVDPTITVAVTKSDATLGDGGEMHDPDVDLSGISEGIVSLRAERSGRSRKEGLDGRVYFITVTADDISGNTAEEILTVLVPHNQ